MIVFLGILLVIVELSRCQQLLNQTVEVQQLISGQLQNTNLSTKSISYYQSINNIGQYRVQIDNDYQFYVRGNQEPYYILNNQFMDLGYDANNDIWVDFNQNFVIINCNAVWKTKIDCGTFLQIHEPQAQNYLIKHPILNSQGPHNISINSLCTGIYHLWLIYSTRVGKILKYVKELRITYPSCDTS